MANFQLTRLAAAATLPPLRLLVKVKHLRRITSEGGNATSIGTAVSPLLSALVHSRPAHRLKISKQRFKTNVSLALSKGKRRKA
jgi:hypothetical protein